MGQEPEAAWQDQLYQLLRQAGVSIFCYVPDAGHKLMIERAVADPAVTAVPLTSEQEGVALAAGAHLGGARSVLLMQSSGVGNCTNMLSLIQHGRFPFLTFVSMRGDFGEGNPWQFAMGRAVQPVLEAMGVIVRRVEKPEDILVTAGAAITMAFQSEMPVAVILSQQLIGAKAFARMSQKLDRRTAVPKLIGNPDDFLIISGLAGAAKDVGALTKESSNTFLFGGAMAGATMTGLGLALAQPARRVLVVTGDGDLLMSLGSLATIGAVKPANLAIVCVDNQLYGETGNQVSHTEFGVDLRHIAEGCGFVVTHEVKSEDQIGEAAQALRASNGPVFVLLKVDGGPPPAYSRNWHAQETKTAFRHALLGKR